MSDDNTAQEGQEEPQPLSPVEQEAMEHGWKPEEEFKADARNEGKRWRTAEDFMDRKSLFDRIEQGNQRTKALEKTLNQLAAHNSKIEKVAYEKALADLKAQRKEALADNDLVRAEELRDEMDEVREKVKQIAPIQVQGDPPALVEFKERNSWYQRDEDMTTYADGLGIKLLQEGKSPDTIFKTVEERVRKAFPDRFVNPNRESAPEMATSSKRAGLTQKFQLSEEERKIMKNFVAQGIMTEDQYIADLKKLRG